MTPEYLYQLAQRADKLEMWRANYLTLEGDDKLNCDTGVALRRYAGHLQELAKALEEKKSVLITPLAYMYSAHRMVDTPPDQEDLRPESRKSEEEIDDLFDRSGWPPL